MKRTDPLGPEAMTEVKARALAIIRNHEAAFVGGLPVDAVLWGSIDLADGIVRHLRAVTT